ncbi:hypothetical protein ZTR_06124 [Talaromyces verruculosus]|nr:hypothetical protein ZTR_06124 [Talaromyces verruculosus]
MSNWVDDCHKQYGEVVRLGSDRLSYINAEAWKDIYGHRIKGKKSCQKDRKFYETSNGIDNIFTIHDDQYHGKVRRIFSHAFSDKALKDQEIMLAKYVDKLIENMRKNAHKKGDMVKYYNFTTFDIMGDLSFGEPLGLLENSEYSPWVAAVFSSVKLNSFAHITLEYPWVGTLWKMFVPQWLIDAQKMHKQHAVERVDRRLQKGNDNPDIWNLILRQEDGQRLPLKEMYSNADGFMTAGTETTATLLSGLTYYLLKNPDKMRKLVQEIRTSFAAQDELTIEKLRQLKYMAACFEEGLRCYPPVPNGLYRTIPEGGAAICGEYLPEGTRVCVTQYSAFHAESNFKHADAFIPERWMCDSAFDQDHRDVMQPFSVGPRNCLGKNLAYHEMRLILSKVLWNFDLKLCKESENWTNQRSYTLWEKPPLMVEFTPVN